MIEDILPCINPRLQQVAAAQPYPVLFATVSGAHLYGFPSPDSDFDLRGAHILPLTSVLGLECADLTLEISDKRDGFELDLVTHDIAKFFSLLLKPNGYVLEQLYSPLIVCTSSEHQELKELARGCITCFHSHHYLGFAQTQWKLFEKETPHRVKPLLYVFRVLLTGIFLMRTGQVEANLPVLNETFKLPYIDELVRRKQTGPEASKLPDGDCDFYRKEYERLISMLEICKEETHLPKAPSTRIPINDLLIRVRLQRAGMH